MEHRCLGRTGLRISRLALGTVNFGRLLAPRESFDLLDRAVDAGINLVDTADEYANGLTERIIGEWLGQDRARRRQVVLATKVYETVGSGPNDGGLSAYHIRRACEGSLGRLRTDHIDLYQMRHVDRSTPWEEIWQAMEQLVREGKISYVGSSNFAGWQIAHAQGLARERRFLGLVSEQSVYNLATRMVELEVLPACQALGVGFLAYSPLAEGLLAGGLSKAQAATQYYEGQAEARLVALAERTGHIDRAKTFHPLTQLYAHRIAPRVRVLQQADADAPPGIALPEKTRADYTREVFHQLLAESPVELSSEEADFFVEQGLRRELGTEQRSTFWRSMLKANRLQDRLERYDALCREHGLAPAQLALAWLCHRPGVTSILIGPRTAEHLHSSVAALDDRLTPEQLEQLDGIFPGPGGAAPEAYAW